MNDCINAESELRQAILRNLSDKPAPIVSGGLLAKYVRDKNSLSAEELSFLEEQLATDQQLQMRLEAIEKVKPAILGAETPYSEL